MRRALNHPLAWLVIAYLAWRRGWAFSGIGSQDLAVYLRGASDLLTGLSPYRDVDALPYTYPPFSAIVFAPLTWLTRSAAELVFLGMSVAAYLALLWIVGRRLRWTTIEIAWAAVIGLRLEPLVRTFDLGQVNFLLAAMVALDLFVVPRKYRGILIGLAAGIKLTPSVFGVAFLLHRQWAAAIRCAVSGLATVAIGAVVMPSDSWRYWTELLRDPRRIGALNYADNQSLVGVAARALDAERLSIAQMLPLELLGAALGCAAAWVCARRLRDPDGRPDQVAVALALALASLLASPVSWSHHWVWAIPGVMWLLTRRRWVAAAAWTAALYAANWLLPELRPDPPYDNPWWAATMPLLAVLTLVVGLALATVRRPGAAATTGAHGRAAMPAA